MMKILTFNKLAAWIVLSFIMLMISSVSADSYPESGDSQAGAKVWAENCGRCHNYRGGSDLRNDQWITTAFHMRIRGGLTGQEMRDVLSFLKSSNRPIASVSPVTLSSGVDRQKSGSEIFGQTCVACHGSDGKGLFPGVPDFTRSDGVLTKEKALLVKNITYGVKSPGSTIAMPPKGGNPLLTDKDVMEVLNYLKRSFSE